MCSEEFSLSWNDHHRSVVGVLGRYFNEGTLVDCTIAAEGEHLEAHRLVLSACSSYFELLFSQEKKKEKVVVLEDIKFQDLKSLITFMYNGNVTLPKDRLLDFLRAAGSLQIKGLPSDLSQNSQRETTEQSVVCRKEGLASQLSHRDTRCAIRESGDLQCTSSFRQKVTVDENPSICMQTDLSEENAFALSQSMLERDINRETAELPVEREPPVEPKEEVEVEVIPIWEKEDESSSTATDVSSATVKNKILNELTPVQSSINSRCRFVHSSHIVEKGSVTSIPKFSCVSATIPSSTNAVSSAHRVSNVPTKEGCCMMEDSSLCVQTRKAEPSICVKNELVVKGEVIPAEVSLHGESLVEPMHAVWVEDVQSWEGEEVITETGSADISYQETTIQDLDVAASSAPDKNQSAVWPNVVLDTFASSWMMAQRDKMEVGVQEEETEIDERCKGQECKSVDVNDRAVDKVVESGQCSIIEIGEINVKKEEHVMEGQEMMLETVERALKSDIAVEQSDAEEEDSAPLSEPICRILGKTSHKSPDVFHTVSDLRLHFKNLHKEQRSHRCEVCKATFAYRSKLMRHVRMHTGERPFQCSVCKSSFICKSYLTIHMRTHTGERPFQCEVCEKSFSRISNLTTHERLHSGVRPFKCSVCNRSFIQKSNLTTHMRTHTGERPFHCNVCGGSFSHKCALTKHMHKCTG